MKYSLSSRELIADSVESMAMAHPFDGLVLIPNCDKIIPGRRRSRPHGWRSLLIFLPGGHAAGPGTRAKTPGSTRSSRPSAGSGGRITAGELKKYAAACPGAGSCAACSPPTP